MSSTHTVTNVGCSCPNSAYTLNLRGTDIPYNPLFHAYLFVGLDNATIFVDSSKVDETVEAYLQEIGVERKDYTDLWPYLRKRPWGEGKLLLSPQTSYAISLMLTNFRYTIAPSFVEQMMAVKNETEIEGMRRAYLRDGASFVRLFTSYCCTFLTVHYVRFASWLGLRASSQKDTILLNTRPRLA